MSGGLGRLPLDTRIWKAVQLSLVSVHEDELPGTGSPCTGSVPVANGRVAPGAQENCDADSETGRGKNRCFLHFAAPSPSLVKGNILNTNVSQVSAQLV